MNQRREGVIGTRCSFIHNSAFGEWLLMPRSVPGADAMAVRTDSAFTCGELTVPRPVTGTCG